MKFTVFCSLGVVTLLGACSGGGGGGVADDNDSVIPSFASAAAVGAEGDAATARVRPLGFTAAADVPTSGTADYDGTIVINDQLDGSDNASVFGGFTVSIDFADADNVTGAAGNFFDLANTPVGGTLQLSGVEFSGGTAGNGFVGDLDGRLTNVGTAGNDDAYDYDLEIGGIYFGSEAQGVTTLIQGTANQVGSTTANEVEGAGTLELR